MKKTRARKAEVKELPEEREWVVPVRMEFDGYVIVKARTAEEAASPETIGGADLEPGAALVNWEARGKARPNV